jgi:type I restriction-modification system DNA methylase subunit
MAKSNPPGDPSSITDRPVEPTADNGLPDRYQSPVAIPLTGAPVTGSDVEEAISEIMSPLDAIHGFGVPYHDIISDFLDLSLGALGVNMESEYMDVVEDYDDRFPGSAVDTERITDLLEDQQHLHAESKGQQCIYLFTKAFSLLVDHSYTTRRDLIGEIYMKFGTKDDRLGQHFTPPNVSNFMSQLVGAMDDDPPTTHDLGFPIREGRPETIDEALEVPSDTELVADNAGCGSGRMLLAACRDNHHRFAYGIDVDSRCARMAALNCALFGIDAIIVHGDGLTQEKHALYRIAPFESQMCVVKQIPEDD